MPCDSMFVRIFKVSPALDARLKFNIVNAVLLAALVSPFSLARAGEGLAYVDISFLIENAPQSRIASESLKEEFAQRQSKLEKKRIELEDLKTTIALESVQTDVDGLQELTQDYRSLEHGLKIDEIEFREALNIRKNSEFKLIRSIVIDAVTQFGKLNDFDMILSEGALYVDSSVNVTDRILQSLIEQSKSDEQK